MKAFLEELELWRYRGLINKWTVRCSLDEVLGLPDLQLPGAAPFSVSVDSLPYPPPPP